MPRTTRGADAKAMGLPPGEPNREKDDFSVVGAGASAGGLDAFQKFLDALPEDSGMAFVLVQHLDPTHDSMMAELLAPHTKMPVRQAGDGMPIERNVVYVIPPGQYLSVRDRTLRLSEPDDPRGARLAFDYLLRSLADDLGDRAICVILSGTGTDGSLGAKAVREAAGLVVAQDPEEAAFDGMPRNAIGTGAVDMVLPLAEMPNAIVRFNRRLTVARSRKALQPDATNTQGPFREIVDLLRGRTGKDFAIYKQGTIERRIDRRRAMATPETVDLEGYVQLLRTHPAELDLLAKDLYINVTSFFRDPTTFGLLASGIVSEMVTECAATGSLRIWSAGCSTGEEAYSLAMLFREAIEASGSQVKLQIFASDVDADAVAVARSGIYPETIAAEVSAERLARFFAKEEHGYRVLPELRELVVFTVHDVMNDPPFSRLDLIACRNVLIYLKHDAQAKIITLFHFALRPGGLLLLGGSEMVAADDARFEPVSKSERLYRHVGRARPGELAQAMNFQNKARQPTRGKPAGAPPDNRFADLCRDLLMETYAPAAVLVDRDFECLYTVGPTDRYLRVAPGRVTNNLIAMMRQTGLQARVRLAAQRAAETKERVVISGGRLDGETGAHSFSIVVRPVANDGEALSLICFVDEPERARRDATAEPSDESTVAELERELKATQEELEAALHNLHASNEEQNAINEEALSVNEEFQSTNEELLTSKEELQSLNEELVALNSQLQETLDLQRTTAGDLENILRSTEVATFFLDADLDIRFFTPAAKSIFNVIPSDIGRPLADLRTVSEDAGILDAARTVMRTGLPNEREVRIESGAWFVRRILPYRTTEGRSGGVVITFTDITARKRSELALEAAKKRAEDANIAKSRFLAAASHDLRQPLQTIALIQGRLERTVEGEKPQKLIRQLDQTLAAVSGMLNTLLDINQIDSGTVTPAIADVRIDTLFDRLRDEFAYQANAKGLDLRVVRCGLTVRSDQRLLDQIIRNVLSNALKYTRKGKVLLGCRRRGNAVTIEVRDTGIGIPEAELHSVFDEYHQVDNAARERNRGLGLGLAIVKRLADLLGHRVGVRSQVGKGSVFTIEIAAPSENRKTSGRVVDDAVTEPAARSVRCTGSILVVEDDPDVRELLDDLLVGEGHTVVSAEDGVAALQAVTQGAFRPDLILADFNLPKVMNGVEVAMKLRAYLGHPVPTVLLTGDISVASMHEIETFDCVRLNKPVKAEELSSTVQRLLATPPAVRPTPDAQDTGSPDAQPTIHLVDDSDELRETLRDLLAAEGFVVEDYPSGEAFFDRWQPGGEACLLLDASLPGISGLELLDRLREAGHRLPVVILTAFGDVTMAVDAMKRGASDFIEKPVSRDDLLTRIRQALELSRDETGRAAWQEEAEVRIAGLTPRQRQILVLILAGRPNKNIAAELGISQRTVESHRATIMRRTDCRSLPALARLALAAGLPMEL